MIEEIATPFGLARAHVTSSADPRALLVLGHGAGGGIGARDLVAAATVAQEEGFAVALVEQPYRVAGRRSAAPAHQLDTAWSASVAALSAGPLGDRPLVVGGRSSGARVACRTAKDVGASAVLCLAFPLQPPGGKRPDRLAELASVKVPVLVVQGERDPFGIPPAARRRRIVIVPGDHALRATAEVAAAVRAWLRRIRLPDR